MQCTRWMVSPGRHTSPTVKRSAYCESSEASAAMTMLRPPAAGSGAASPWPPAAACGRCRASRREPVLGQLRAAGGGGGSRGGGGALRLRQRCVHCALLMSRLMMECRARKAVD